jgi:hypothetical protein
MRWNPFRRGAPADAESDAVPGSPPTDKLTMAIRQRRMFTAQQRVDQLPGFAKLERRWCEPPTADELDEKRAALDTGVSARWADGPTLAAALSAAAAVAPTTPTRAFVLHESEARWVEARQGELLEAVAVALPALLQGVTLLADDGSALDVALPPDVDGRVAFETTLHGQWPDEVRAALTPTMPR